MPFTIQDFITVGAGGISFLIVASLFWYMVKNILPTLRNLEEALKDNTDNVSQSNERQEKMMIEIKKSNDNVAKSLEILSVSNDNLAKLLERQERKLEAIERDNTVIKERIDVINIRI